MPFSILLGFTTNLNTSWGSWVSLSADATMSGQAFQWCREFVDLSLSFLIWWVKNTVIPYFFGQAYKVHKISCLDKANRYLTFLDSSVFIFHSWPSDLLRCKYYSTPLLKFFQSHANAWQVLQAAFSLLKKMYLGVLTSSISECDFIWK